MFNTVAAIGLIAMLSGGAAAAPVANLAPYEFIIGEWDIHEEGAPPAAISRAKWGPNGSSIWIEADLLMGGKQVPHYAGLLLWNGVRGDLDMLLNLDPVGGKVNERGRVWVDQDGVVIRDVIATYAPGVGGPDGKKVGPGGAEFVFQQKYKAVAPDKIETSMMRQTAGGWVATFPGSESILMTRRGAS